MIRKYRNFSQQKLPTISKTLVIDLYLNGNHCLHSSCVWSHLIWRYIDNDRNEREKDAGWAHLSIPSIQMKGLPFDNFSTSEICIYFSEVIICYCFQALQFLLKHKQQCSNFWIVLSPDKDPDRFHLKKRTFIYGSRTLRVESEKS